MATRAMTDEELASITRDVMERFKASIEFSDAERATFFATTTVRLLYEVRRMRDPAPAAKKVTIDADDVAQRADASHSIET